MALSVTHLSSASTRPNEAYVIDGQAVSLIQQPFELRFATKRLSASSIRSSFTRPAAGITARKRSDGSPRTRPRNADRGQEQDERQPKTPMFHAKNSQESDGGVGGI